MPCDCEAMARGTLPLFVAGFYRLEAVADAQVGVSLQVDELIGIDEDGTVTNEHGTTLFRLVVGVPDERGDDHE